MKSRRLVKIFQGELELAISKVIKIKPQANDTTLVGILSKGEMDISISMYNGLEPIVNTMRVDNSASLAPDKRIMYLNEPIKDKFITGVIRMSDREPHEITGSVYLIIE